MAGHVFISYASSDSQAALRICSAIEERGIRCWIAPRDVQPGSDYGAALEDAIGESAAMVLVLSVASNKSPQVRREVERAASKDITIVPFMTEKVELSKSLRFFISTHHWLDATSGPLEPYVQKLVETTERFVRTDSGGAPARQEPPAVSTEREMLGAMVGDYRITAKLGAGGFGVVYGAVEQPLDRAVALKTINPVWARDPEFRERFFAEAKVQAKLMHPNIVTIHRFFECDGQYFVTMELLEGLPLPDGSRARTLGDLIKRGPIPVVRLQQIFGEALAAVAYAHDHGVLHQDIRPTNILFTESGLVKVADFGMPRIVGGEENAPMTGARVAGGLGYMSPEYLLNKPLDRRSDIYSLGITLYEMATGELPRRITAEDWPSLLSIQPPSPREKNPSLPVELEGIILRAMAEKPHDRFASCDEFIAAIRAIGKPPQAVVPTFVGMTIDETDESLAAAGLRLAVVAEEFNDTVPAGAVLAQDPAAGGGLDKGAVVRVVLSKGKQQKMVAVPNFLGLPRAQAERAIADLGLVPTIESEDYSAEIMAGSVLRQSTPAGVVLPEGSAVGLMLSLGERERLAAANEVTGEAKDEALASAQSDGRGLIIEPLEHAEPGAAEQIFHRSLECGGQSAAGSGTQNRMSSGRDPESSTNRSAVTDPRSTSEAEMQQTHPTHEPSFSFAHHAADAEPAGRASPVRKRGVWYALLAAAVLLSIGVAGLFLRQRTPATRNARTVVLQLPEGLVEVPHAGSDSVAHRVYFWGRDSSLMVGIPSGTFPMGGTIDEGDADEQPQHPVNLTTYFIDKCEVSNRQYRKFCDLTHRAYPQDPGFPNMPDYIRGFPNYPVVNVTWNDAVAYCAWAGKRLPTEAEWEKAARGPEWSKYPWGNSIRSAAGKHVANYNPGDFQGDGYERTSPVDSFASGASPYGSLNMGGNVWEWCSDWYDDGYYRVSPRDNPQGPRSGAQRVYRGGGWFTGSRQMRCSERSSAPPERYLHYLGFRCVVSGTTNAGS